MTNIFNKLPFIRNRRNKLMDSHIDAFLIVLKSNQSHNTLTETEVFKLLYTHLLMLNYKYEEIGDVLYIRYNQILESCRTELKKQSKESD